MSGATIDELRFLDAAVRLGSFSAAARDLGVTQQAVSARIRELERRLGDDLVHRSSAGVEPTDFALAVLDQVREVLAAADRLDERIAATRGADARPLRIAASQTIAAHLLPGWLLELRGAQAAAGRPQTRVDLSTGNSRTVAELVRVGAVDLGFIETPEMPEGLGATIVRRDRMVVSVAPGHPWAGRPGVPIDEVARTPLIAREAGSGTRAAFEQAAMRHRTQVVAPLLELATEAAVRSAVAEGVAPAVLSELTVRDDVALGRLSALPFLPDPVERPLSAIWRGTPRDLSGPRRELIEIASRAPA